MRIMILLMLMAPAALALAQYIEIPLLRGESLLVPCFAVDVVASQREASQAGAPHRSTVTVCNLATELCWTHKSTAPFDELKQDLEDCHALGN